MTKRRFSIVFAAFGLAAFGLAGCTTGAVVSSGSAGQSGGGAAGAGAGTTGQATGAAGVTGAAGQASGAAGQSTSAAGQSPDGGANSDAGPVYDVPPPPMAARGATVPWLEYEAEDAATNGVAVGPDRTFGTIASESSGRRAVRLEQPGQYVELTSTARANALVVRYVIPDAPAGGGLPATLDVYVDGALKQALPLTSKYAWSYGGEASTSNDPSQGGAHHFYDEARALVGDIAPGAKVRLQKDAANTAASYVIDLVDLEYVAPPLTKPATFLSLQDDCGATPDDGQDDDRALQTCVKAAKNMGKGVWIPPGNWDMTASMGDLEGVEVSNVAVRGAGMWYSNLRGPWARLHCVGAGCVFSDFAISGETVARDDTAVDNGFNGGAGTGSRLENVWVEHTKVGYWVGEGAQNVTNGLVVTGCRFRDLAADGVNFNNGTSNSEIVNSHFRNTGDDAAASWAQAATGVNTANVIHFNTVQVPWRANCFGVYGGKDNRVEDNLCYDTVTYPGVLVAQQFTSQPFSGTTVVQRNSFVRAGGHMYNQEQGAIKIYSGLQLQGPAAITNATFDTLAITNAGSFGIAVVSMTSGAGTFSNVTVTNAARGGLGYDPGATFSINQGGGNSGW
jgi:hypothetical protein